MRQIAVLFVLVSFFTSCVSVQEHYYKADTPHKLYNRPSDRADLLAEIQSGDTIIAKRRLGGDGHFYRVTHNGRTGYVRSFNTPYLYSSRSGRSNSSFFSRSTSSSSLDMSRPVHVRSHTRTLKSGKTVQVRAHTRSSPGSGSRSSSKGYRSSSTRSSSSGYRSSGGRSSGRH